MMQRDELSDYIYKHRNTGNYSETSMHSIAAQTSAPALQYGRLWCAESFS